MNQRAIKITDTPYIMVAIKNDAIEATLEGKDQTEGRRLPWNPPLHGCNKYVWSKCYVPQACLGAGIWGI